MGGKKGNKRSRFPTGDFRRGWKREKSCRNTVVKRKGNGSRSGKVRNNAVLRDRGDLEFLWLRGEGGRLKRKSGDGQGEVGSVGKKDTDKVA